VTTGTLSLLVGVHQVVVHPITVAVAWRRLNGAWPTWREAICIVVHDWGYLGCRSMDNEEDGGRHPELGAAIAHVLFGRIYRDLVLYHSRHYAIRDGREPSELCWPDKASLLYERWWTYLPRARLSGELAQYRENAAGAGAVPASASDREWFHWMQEYFRRISENMILGEYLNHETRTKT
jgi:hypothetical protein